MFRVKSEGRSCIDRIRVFMYFLHNVLHELLLAPSTLIVDAEKRREAET
jgi:hypothetical protein